MTKIYYVDYNGYKGTCEWLSEGLDDREVVVKTIEVFYDNNWSVERVIKGLMLTVPRNKCAFLFDAVDILPKGTIAIVDDKHLVVVKGYENNVYTSTDRYGTEHRTGHAHIRKSPYKIDQFVIFKDGGEYYLARINSFEGGITWKVNIIGWLRAENNNLTVGKSVEDWVIIEEHEVAWAL